MNQFCASRRVSRNHSSLDESPKASVRLWGLWQRARMTRQFGTNEIHHVAAQMGKGGPWVVPMKRDTSGLRPGLKKGRQANVSDVASRFPGAQVVQCKNAVATNFIGVDCVHRQPQRVTIGHRADIDSAKLCEFYIPPGARINFDQFEESIPLVILEFGTEHTAVCNFVEQGLEYRNGIFDVAQSYADGRCAVPQLRGQHA